MKKKEVQIGHTYVVKVSGKLTAVKITGESPYGNGWNGFNVATNRKVYVRSATRLRREVRPPAPAAQQEQEPERWDGMA